MHETTDSKERISTATQSNPWNPLSSFRCSWWWSLPIGIVLAIIAAYATLISFEPLYRATSLLEANTDYVVFRDVHPTRRHLTSSESDLFFHIVVLDPVLADPQLRKAPSLSNPETAEINLRKNLSVADAGASRMIVSYEDTDREAAAMVCNSIVTSYLRQRDAFDSSRVSNMERWLEPEIDRWQHEVEQRQRAVHELTKLLLGFAPSNPAAAAESESNLGFFTKLRSQINDVTVRIAVLDAQLAFDTPVVASQSEEDESQPDPELARWVKTTQRKRDLLAVELEVLSKKYDEERTQLERLAGSTAELQFAQEELGIATDVLTKLRSRVAAIRTESRQDGAVRCLFHASPPRQPINSPPFRRATVISGIAFLTPLMLAFLLGFKRNADDGDAQPTESPEGNGTAPLM